MYLNKIEIKNFRQFKNEELNFNELLTIIAGSNNSGKTGIGELFNILFSRSGKFEIEDISRFYYYDFIIKLEELLKNKDEDNENEYIEKFKNDNTNRLIRINLEISYEENENFSLFSDYLMELDIEIRSFYFSCIYEFDYKKFLKQFDIECFEIKEYLKKDKNRKFFISCFDTKIYFTDKEFQKLLSMNFSDFQRLFNYEYINATRVLNDTKQDSHFSLSKEMLNNFRKTENWETLTEILPEKLHDVLGDLKVNEEIENYSVLGLQDVIAKIVEHLDHDQSKFFLKSEITEENLMSFLMSMMQVNFKFENKDGKEGILREHAQGLGFSNLIYMCLRIERFSMDANAEKVNIFFTEEPEAHMHPQMERILLNYLKDDFKTKKIQGILTTHSNEIVKNSDLNDIRIIRIVSLFSSQIFDMKKFKKNLGNNEEKKFYNFLFSINYSDLIFARKIIMYEGDTEKMYLSKLLCRPQYEILSKQLISFVQVGGAYVHWYKKLIEYLKIKTVIFTDIDYTMDKITKKTILDSGSTNEGLLSFYKDDINSSDIIIKVSDILKWKQKNDLIRVFTQTEVDGLSRTLEEAMFCKLLKMEVFTKQTINFWKEIRDSKKLKFSIPIKDKITIRDIINSTKDKKTDFMYSVILEKLDEEMLPNYIKEGLNWLQE